jgi:hypothetical protein
MLRMKLVLIAGLTVLFAVGSFTAASAQSAPDVRYALRAARPHILITPRPYPYYRRCVERLELQYRPSGPVLYPLTYCWWVWG